MAEPQFGGPEAEFRAALAAGHLRLQFCNGCGRAVHYPRVVCPFCASTALEFRDVDGAGTIYSTTVELRREATEGPVNLSLVDLDAGARIYAPVVNCDPHTVHIGQRVRARIARRKDVPVLVFEPLASGETVRR